MALIRHGHVGQPLMPLPWHALSCTKSRPGSSTQDSSGAGYGRHYLCLLFLKDATEWRI